MPTLFTSTSSPPSAAAASPDGSLGLARASQVGHDVRDLADTGRVPSSAGDDAGALADELAHHLEPDASGRAGDEAPLAVESEIHEPG